MTNTSRPLDKLERTIAARAAKPHEKSYTSQLLTGGVQRIGAKIIEEAAEVVEAAGEAASAAGESGAPARQHFIHEVADLLYHLLVLMRARDCTLSDVESELARRFGVSGLKEKASREKAAKKKVRTKKKAATRTQQASKRKPKKPTKPRRAKR